MVAPGKNQREEEDDVNGRYDTGFICIVDRFL